MGKLYCTVFFTGGVCVEDDIYMYVFVFVVAEGLA